MARAVFLDRDGVINAAIYNPLERKLDSPYRAQEFRLLPGVSEAVREIDAMGFLPIVVSNQPGVAKGKCQVRVLDAITGLMTTSLATEGAYLAGVYYCYHHPEAVEPSLRSHCDCRKPRPGLLLAAAREHGIELSRSYMVGDQETDIEAGTAAGCRTILLNGHRGAGQPGASQARPLRVVENLLAAARMIRHLEGGGEWRYS